MKRELPNCLYGSGTSKALSKSDQESAETPLLEKNDVFAKDVFFDQRFINGLLGHRAALKRYEDTGKLPGSIREINGQTVPDGYVPEELSHQEVSGRQLVKQAKIINNAPFLKAINAHAGFRDLPGFEKQRRIFSETQHAFNLLTNMGNVFRKDKVHTLLGSIPEVRIAQKTYGAIWPSGINLYDILREMYPAFHARITGQVPAYIADNLEHVLDNTIGRHSISGVGRFTVDEKGRFLGLYPVAEVPKDQVTLDSRFISQDQGGRKIIAKNVLSDAIGILRKDLHRRILVIDYAGGVGNISELLIRQIYSLPDDVMKARLLRQMRFAVIDISTDQLAAGRNRFTALNQRFSRVDEKVVFLHGDVTMPFTEAHKQEMMNKFGKVFLNKPVCIGMTSYTIGALENMSQSDGRTYAQAMADEMFSQCWKIYALDFSSPLWRRQGFISDTGKWGKEYLRTLHGVTEQDDETTPLNRLLAFILKLRFGLQFNNVAEFVRYMSLAPALASHYMTVWPGIDGHNAGYTLLEDGTMKKPGIIMLAERLKEQAAKIDLTSRVWSVITMDLGKTSKNTRAWAFVPGWMSDFVVAEDLKKRP